MTEQEPKDSQEQLSVPVPISSPKASTSMLLPKLAPAQGSPKSDQDGNSPEATARNIVVESSSHAHSSTSGKNKMRVRVSVSARLKEDLQVLFPDLGWNQTTTALSKVLEEVPTLVNAVRAVQRAAMTHQDETLRLGAILTDRDTVVKVLEEQVERKHALLVQYNADVVRLQQLVDALKGEVDAMGGDGESVIKRVKEAESLPRKRPGSDLSPPASKRVKTNEEKDSFSDNFHS